MSDMHCAENDMEVGSFDSQPDRDDAAIGAANVTGNNESDKKFDATAELRDNTVGIRLVNSKKELDEADTAISASNESGERMTSFPSITDDVQAKERKSDVHSTVLTVNENSTRNPVTEFDKYDAVRSEHSATSGGVKHAKKPTRQGE